MAADATAGTLPPRPRFGPVRRVRKHCPAGPRRGIGRSFSEAGVVVRPVVILDEDFGEGTKNPCPVERR